MINVGSSVIRLQSPAKKIKKKKIQKLTFKRNDNDGSILIVTRQTLDKQKK